MTVLTLTIEDERIAADVDGRAIAELPVGVERLAADLRGDPPLPEELTNAIGLVIDHLDDLVRDAPDVLAHQVAVRGAVVGVVADVEAGGPQALPHRLGREELEEVFRTLATEPIADRRHNPGLPGNEVERVVAACCILVAVARRLKLDALAMVGAQ